jgi:hypothetical protein
LGIAPHLSDYAGTDQLRQPQYGLRKVEWSTFLAIFANRSGAGYRHDGRFSSPIGLSPQLAEKKTANDRIT